MSWSLGASSGAIWLQAYPWVIGNEGRQVHRVMQRRFILAASPFD